MTPPTPSALTSLIAQTGSDPISALTTQVLHNLQHQHLWTSLQTHHLPPQKETAQDTSSATVLISGIPPHRVYTHPDEQLYLLELGLREQDLPPERMLVLPTTQGQSWTLSKLAGVFDSLPTLEPVSTNSSGHEPPGTGEDSEDQKKAAKLAIYFERRQQASKSQEWGGKRLLLAMVDRLRGGDGTVVYYVFQEGIVKPRQN